MTCRHCGCPIVKLTTSPEVWTHGPFSTSLYPHIFRYYFDCQHAAAANDGRLYHSGPDVRYDPLLVAEPHYTLLPEQEVEDVIEELDQINSVLGVVEPNDT